MPEVWGLLGKAQDDAQTIDEAIASAFVAHEADESAHVDAGESLYSHKAEAIIDHLAESVVNDKIKHTSRKYIAVVDEDSPSDFDNIPDALSYADTFGGGTIFVKRGYYPISSDLQLPRAVDIEGEGINETILDFAGNSNSILTHNKVDLQDGYYGGVGYVNGSAVVTFPGGTTLISDGVIAGQYLNVDGGARGLYLIESVDTEEQITLATNYTDTTGSYDTDTQWCATMTNGSNVVTFPAGIDLDALGIKVGFYFYAVGLPSNNSYVKTVDSASQLTLIENYTGGGGVTHILLEDQHCPVHELNNFSILSCANDYAIKGGTNPASAHIKKIRFEECHGCVSLDGENVTNSIEENEVYNCGAYILFYLTNYTVRNNYIYSWAAGTTIFKVGTTCYIYGNRVNLGNSSGGYLFELTGNNVAIENNYFSGFQNFDTNASTRNYIRLINNYITAQNTYDINFRHQYSSISGNTIFQELVLTANSKKVIVSGNWLDRAITDSGTSNDTDNNVVGT